MDKAKLKKHKRKKSRLQRVEREIVELCNKEVDVVSGKVTGSSKDFPYTEVRTTIQMYNPEKNDRLNEQIRGKEAERLVLQKEVDEVEEYIKNIPDPEIKEIFELSFVKGEKQQEVADIVGYSRGRISQIISGYLKD